MMVFSELYGAYYNTVAKILKKAVEESSIGTNQINQIIKEYAFRDSSIEIGETRLKDDWHLLLKDLTTPIKKSPTMPLTTLQKSWLKAIELNPRIQLFVDEPFDFSGVKPLFLPEDICVFDRYGDGDDYTDETYRKNFRFLLDAIKSKSLLDIEWENKRGKPIKKTVMPSYLEYSEKDDKFRLAGAGIPFGGTINLSRIISCEKHIGEIYLKKEDRKDSVKDKRAIGAKNGSFYFETKNARHSERVVFELVDERHALERVLLHFAHFKKEAEKLDETHYRVTINYHAGDETEMVIRILSFGPMIRVISPDSFIELMKDRLMKQKRFL